MTRNARPPTVAGLGTRSRHVGPCKADAGGAQALDGRLTGRMFAVISDIHGNYEALQTALEDIDRRSIRTIFCLGDIVGYGASPRECLDTVIDRCEFSLCGNHDQAVFFEPSNFNVGAERAAYWTRQVLEDDPNKAKRDRRWEVLGRLPIRREAKGLLMVHASPRRPVNEYLFPEDVYTNPGKILDNFKRLEAQHMACLVGHTHVPGVFLDDPCFDPPDELSEAGIYTVTSDEKAIINVGSIGQPRDRDPRLCYVLIYETGESPEGCDPPIVGDGESYLMVEFVRLEYDVEKAARKIYDVPELDDFLGTRLFEGR
ncbi:MAG: metallophosphoesterase family protein [Phycisphaerales bacterium]|nr:metallophosphoesterase family protein [Phycisphaerales bacterium]